MNVPLHIALPVCALTAIAVRTDVRTRRIPNALTGTALLLALGVHAVSGGWPELGLALLGALVAGGILLPGWLAGWMGAGDVKLMAAVGAWLGVSHGLVAALLALIAGGVLAGLVAARHGVLLAAIGRAAELGRWLLTPHAGFSAPRPTESGIRFPFAVAACAGAFAALWVRP